MQPFSVKFYIQYETKAKVCDAGLHGERVSFLNTCSAFILMLTGSVVAVIVAIQERITGRKKEFATQDMNTYDTKRKSHQTTIVSR